MEERNREAGTQGGGKMCTQEYKKVRKTRRHETNENDAKQTTNNWYSKWNRADDTTQDTCYDRG